jgi:hypothetical protein
VFYDRDKNDENRAGVRTTALKPIEPAATGPTTPCDPTSRTRHVDEVDMS